MFNTRNAMFLAGSIFGVLYGLFAIAVFSPAPGHLASVSFLALVPAALGFLPLAFVDDAQVALYRKAMFIPWVSFIGLLLVMIALGTDLVLIVAFAAPFILVITLAAWIIRGLQLRWLSRQKRFWATVALMVLPFVAVSWEHQALAREETLEVRRAIVTQASARRVWDEILDPGMIGDREYGAGLFGSLGVPHPSNVNRGGNPESTACRNVVLSDGARLFETPVVAEPELRLTATLTFHCAWSDPPTLASKIDTMGGLSLRAIDYRITPAPGGRTRLTMVVQYTLNTSVNPYARTWVDAAIDDAEEHLLAVFKRRAERKA